MKSGLPRTGALLLSRPRVPPFPRILGTDKSLCIEAQQLVAVGKPDAPQHDDDDGGRDSGGPIDPQLVRDLPLARVAEGEEGGAEQSLENSTGQRSAVSANGLAVRLHTHTEMKVAGRKIMVRRAMDFMTLLSWRAMVLYAYTPVSHGLGQ